MQPTHITTAFLGKSKSHIKQALQGEPCTEFAHWLHLPNLGLLLSFQRQYCCGVDILASYSRLKLQ
ncbi:MAG: hypothetical protein Q4G13_07030 [Moraxella sp.]|nr:hypothetical protein [Moraxella sp.]